MGCKAEIKWEENDNIFLQEHDVRDYATLMERTSSASSTFSKLSTTIKDAEKRLNEIAELKKHIFNYSKTRDVYEAYRKSERRAGREKAKGKRNHQQVKALRTYKRTARDFLYLGSKAFRQFF